MLRVVFAPHPQAREEFFHQNKSTQNMWLVAHIEAKRTLQNFLFQERSTIPGQSVLRASEYWHWLFGVNCSDWRAVSESLIFALIENWFETNSVEIRFQNINMFHGFVMQVLPLVAADNEALVDDWLEADEERRERLQGWFEQARRFWRLLERKKWIGRSNVAAVLNLRESLFFGDAENFYFDLGLDLRQEEVDLIIKLSRAKNVTVLVPSPSWAPSYQASLDVYKKILDAADETQTLDSPPGEAPMTLRRSLSVLRECKAAVSQARAWVDAGVPPSEIAILSANIEDYWDILREHFRIEGIPVHKKNVLSAISLPTLQKWLSDLHLQKDDFEQSHLETHLFGEGLSEDSRARYSKFRQEFSHIYHPQQARDFLNLEPARLSKKELTLAEFVEFSSSQWIFEDRSLIEEVYDLMIADLRLKDSFSYPIWLKYLELIISRFEVEVESESPAGLRLLNFNHGDWTSLKHAIVLGCEQKQLRDTSVTPLLPEDVARVELDLGFYLQRTENVKKEFELRWFCERGFDSLCLSHSETDFDGQPQMAAGVWLERQHAKAPLTLAAAKTRWDQLMGTSTECIGEELQWQDLDRARILYKLSLEDSLKEYRPLRSPESVSLSAGGFKTYFTCPFLFYVEKVLRLSEASEFDLDMDALFQGNVLHKLVEDLVRQHPDLQISDSQLSALYDKSVKELNVDSPLRQFWLQEKPRHLIWIKNFIGIESQWRARFPDVKTLASEAVVRGYVGLDGDQVVLTPEARDGFYPLNGRIDRVDQDSAGHLAIVDYKTSESGLRAFKSWASKGLFQMPIYARAIENGLAPDIAAAPVVAASYFIFKDAKRGAGFIAETEGSGFNDDDSSQSVDVLKKEAVFADVFAEMKQILLNIKLGDFKPLPRETESCVRCQWSYVCRAPHLK